MQLTNVKIIGPNTIIDKGTLTLTNTIISQIDNSMTKSDHAIDCNGYRLFPGFIDMHVHGTSGADFMDSSSESIEKILMRLPQEGTTSLLATTMTESLDSIEKALTSIAETKSNGTKILGIHLEGPFINPAYKGAQSENHIIEGSIPIFERLQKAANNKIKLITLAVENQSTPFLEHLIKKDVIVSMGHSNATHEDVIKARELGVKRVTHCYNAMTPIHHREIGLTGASLLYDDITIELIADLKHVSTPALKLAHKMKQNNVNLVTDSMRGKDMPDGEYTLGGQKIYLKDTTPYTETNVLAGSTLHLNVAANNYQKATQITDLDLAKILSTNQAIALNLDKQLGKLEKGYTADMVLVDNDFNVMLTIIDGKIHYRNEVF